MDYVEKKVSKEKMVGQERTVGEEETVGEKKTVGKEKTVSEEKLEDEEKTDSEEKTVGAEVTGGEEKTGGKENKGIEEMEETVDNVHEKISDKRGEKVGKENVTDMNVEEEVHEDLEEKKVNEVNVSMRFDDKNVEENSGKMNFGEENIGEENIGKKNIGKNVEERWDEIELVEDQEDPREEKSKENKLRDPSEGRIVFRPSPVARQAPPSVHYGTVRRSRSLKRRFSMVVEVFAPKPLHKSIGRVLKPRNIWPNYSSYQNGDLSPPPSRREGRSWGWPLPMSPLAAAPLRGAGPPQQAGPPRGARAACPSSPTQQQGASPPPVPAAVTPPAVGPHAVGHPAGAHPADVHPADVHPADVHPAVAHHCVAHPAAGHPRVAHPAVAPPAMAPAAPAPTGYAEVTEPMIGLVSCREFVYNDRLAIREFTNVKQCDKVGTQGGLIVVQKHFETPQKAVDFKTSYEKSMYGQGDDYAKVHVKLMHNPIVFTEGPVKKGPGRPKK